MMKQDELSLFYSRENIDESNTTANVLNKNVLEVHFFRKASLEKRAEIKSPLVRKISVSRQTFFRKRDPWSLA